MIPPKPFEPDYAVHPGRTLQECIIWHFAYYLITGSNYSLDHPDWLKEKVGDDVQALTEQIIAIIEGRAPITEEMATRLSQIASLPRPQFWINYQTNYDKHEKK